MINKKGYFYDMVRHTGKNADIIVAKAEEHAKKVLSLEKDIRVT